MGMRINVNPLGGRVGASLKGWAFWHFLKNIQIPYPWDKIINQITHPGTSGGGQMFLKPWSRAIKISTLGTSPSMKIPTLGTELTINGRG